MQLKDFTSITASLINIMKGAQNKITDFNVGSVARTMLEAPAAEMDELYQQMFIGLRDAIPVSVYNAFGFSALPAQTANGYVRYTITSTTATVVISAGSLFTLTGTGTVFATAIDYLIAPGDTYVDMELRAVTAGLVAPIQAGAAFTPTAQSNLFLSCLALAAFNQGANAETADQQKLRFIAYVGAIHRGTVDAVRYGALTYGIILTAYGTLSEKVQFAVVSEPWLTDSSQPVGLFNVYIHNGLDGASSALVLTTQAVIDGYYDASGNPVPGYKAAGTKAVIIAATNVLITVTVATTIDPAFDPVAARASVTSAITQYISALDIGKDVILAELVTVAMNVPGVTNAIFSAPTTDTTIAFNAKAMPGTLTVT